MPITVWMRIWETGLGSMLNVWDEEARGLDLGPSCFRLVALTGWSGVLEAGCMCGLAWWRGDRGSSCSNDFLQALPTPNFLILIRELTPHIQLPKTCTRICISRLPGSVVLVGI